jgi:F0F1-type ATP synthase assembly protein I
MPATPPKLDRLATAVVVALGATAALDLWSITTQLHRASLLSKFRNDINSVSLGTMSAADHQVSASAIVGGLATLVTGILFIVWLHRIVRRLVVVRPGVVRHSPGWAIGAWFVPFLNLVRPKQIVDDCWRATVPTDDWDKEPPMWFHVWWALWLATNFMSYVSFRWPSDTASQLATGDRIGAVADAVDIVAAGFAISVVLAVARRAAALPVPVTYVFNPPPGWPAPPSGWKPAPGWKPDPSWPAAPDDWTFWHPRA